MKRSGVLVGCARLERLDSLRSGCNLVSTGLYRDT
jgi:hypothetical protein